MGSRTLRISQPGQIARLGLVVLILLSLLGWSYLVVKPAIIHSLMAVSKTAPANPMNTATTQTTTASPQTLPNLKSPLNNPFMAAQDQSAQLPVDLQSALTQQQQSEGSQAYNLKSTAHFSLLQDWTATNPAQNFDLDFSATGVKVNDWKLHLASFDGETASQPQISLSQANRIEYPHANGLTEWYINGPLGLEQGFTLAQPLPQTDSDGWLNLPINFDGVHIQAASQNSDWLTLRGTNGENVGQYGKLSAADTTGHVLESHLEIGTTTQQAVLRVKLSGASYPVTIDPFVQQAELTSSDGQAHDEFGWRSSLSSDGNTALIGTYRSGKAYIFTRPDATSAWTQQIILTPTIQITNTNFGNSVALSDDGNIAVVGAVSTYNVQGAVYVFSRAVSTTLWTQQTIITASDSTAGDYFGSWIDLSGDGTTLFVGAPTKQIGSNGAQGEAYIFTGSGANWAEQTHFIIPGGASSDYFGVTGALNEDGNIAVIGAYEKTIGANTYQGAAYSFVRTGTTWSQSTIITATDGANNDQFGAPIALSNDGNTVLIGATTKTIGINNQQGAAYVYTRNGASWTQQQRLTASDGFDNDNFGMVSISGDGNTALIGAYDKSINPNQHEGVAYLYTNTGGSWTQQQRLRASDHSQFDAFGVVPALNNNGTVALVGAPNKSINNNGGQGAAYVFNLLPASNITLTSNPNPSMAGQSVTFTATVAPITATGSVSFTLNNGTSVSATLSGGIATFITNTLPAGSQPITATYSGDTNLAPSSTTITQTVNLNASTISLASSPNPSSSGQSVTFTATVSPPDATGVVTFTNGTTVLGTASLISGIATYTTSTLPAGVLTVTVTYVGNSVYATSSTSITQTVTGITLTSNPNPSILSQTVTFTATVSPTAASGTVTFTEGVTVLGNTPLVNGTAVFTTANLIVGSHVISATYSGDATYAGASSQPITQVVNAPCAPLVVTSVTDDGSGTTCGTLSYALSQPITGSTPVTITFTLTQGNTITFTGSLTITAKVKAHVTIFGGTFGTTTRIILNGNGVAGDGLHLAGQNYLVNLTIEHFGGRELVLEGTGNRMQGVVVDAS